MNKTKYALIGLALAAIVAGCAGIHAKNTAKRTDAAVARSDNATQAVIQQGADLGFIANTALKADPTPDRNVQVSISYLDVQADVLGKPSDPAKLAAIAQRALKDEKFKNENLASQLAQAKKLLADKDKAIADRDAKIKEEHKVAIELGMFRDKVGTLWGAFFWFIHQAKWAAFWTILVVIAALVALQLCVPGSRPVISLCISAICTGIKGVWTLFWTLVHQPLAAGLHFIETWFISEVQHLLPKSISNPPVTTTATTPQPVDTTTK